MQAIVSRAEAKKRGEAHYFTGKACVHGHIAARVTSTGNCAECNRLRNASPELKAMRKAWSQRPENMEAARKKSAAYHAQNRDAILEKMKVRNRAYYLANREAIIAASGDYQSENREKRNAYKSAWQTQRKKEDPQFCALLTMRKLVARACERIKANRRQIGRTAAVLGYTSQEFKAHIERQFLPGMTWENHGEWHVDHIHPLASFDLLDPAQRKAANDLPNLRPIWAEDNLKKSDAVLTLL